MNRRQHRKIFKRLYEAYKYGKRYRLPRWKVLRAYDTMRQR